MVFPIHARQPRHETVIQFLELWTLFLNNVANFVSVFCGQEHSNITAITEAGDPFEQFGFGEFFWEC